MRQSAGKAGLAIPAENKMIMGSVVLMLADSFYISQEIKIAYDNSLRMAHIVGGTMALCRLKRSVNCAARREEKAPSGYTMMPCGKTEETAYAACSGAEQICEKECYSKWTK